MPASITPFVQGEDRRRDEGAPRQSMTKESLGAGPALPINKVVILGSGPAGLTAALYTARANMSPLLIEGHEPGGQLTITTDVENYPGYEHGIQGPEMMEVFRRQVTRFGTRFMSGAVTEVRFGKRPFELI